MKVFKNGLLLLVTALLSASCIGDQNTVIGQEFDEFVKDKYGDMLQGQRDTALYNNTFVNLLTNIGNIGRYVRGK